MSGFGWSEVWGVKTTLRRRLQCPQNIHKKHTNLVKYEELGLHKVPSILCIVRPCIVFFKTDYFFPQPQADWLITGTCPRVSIWSGLFTGKLIESCFLSCFVYKSSKSCLVNPRLHHFYVRHVARVYHATIAGTCRAIKQAAHSPPTHAASSGFWRQVKTRALPPGVLLLAAFFAASMSNRSDITRRSPRLAARGSTPAASVRSTRGKTLMYPSDVPCSVDSPAVAVEAAKVYQVNAVTSLVLSALNAQLLKC
jgi:hypothetical protein